MNIVIPDDYQDCVRSLACFSRLAGHQVTIYNDTVKDLDSLAARFKDAEALVLIRERIPVDAALLARLPRLKLISQTGKVASHLNVADCTARGVAVADGSGSGAATAEFAWMLTLASRRHLVAEANRLKAGLWQHTLGQELKGQTLGILGYGRIGQQVAQYGKAFGMKVMVWGREASLQGAARDDFIPAASREAFYSEADVLSVHVRLTPATHGYITAADLARMKPGALFVNTSRAELVEPGALVEALKRGRPGFGAVDVYESEPVLGASHPLLQLDNALCTPHLGFVERDNYEAYFGHAFDNINAFAKGQPANLVNPEVWKG
ncbi:MAG: D-2-hydroxyacid dehydrogenase family protein [Candidatus Protistobacter heckmanni]|nr:D-2-hydroxyacid dehydrogenase family protein [Candidatus Protistobacter heckmanni]